MNRVPNCDEQQKKNQNAPLFPLFGRMVKLMPKLDLTLEELEAVRESLLYSELKISNGPYADALAVDHHAEYARRIAKMEQLATIRRKIANARKA